MESVLKVPQFFLNGVATSAVGLFWVGFTQQCYRTFIWLMANPDNFVECGEEPQEDFVSDHDEDVVSEEVESDPEEAALSLTGDRGETPGITLNNNSQLNIYFDSNKDARQEDTCKEGTAKEEGTVKEEDSS